MLDTVVTAETPEGILLELRPAGLTARFYAFALDWVIRLAVFYAASFIAVFMGGIGLAFWIVLFFALEWFYPVVFELGRTGATPGKRAFGLKVVMDSGLPVTPAASLTRNLLRAADFLPFAYGFATVSMLIRSDHKRLGDLAAATLVVHAPRAAPRAAQKSAAQKSAGGKAAPPHIEAKAALPNVEPVRPAAALAPADQAALIALAARAPTLTGERLDELAALAAPASGNPGQSGPEVTRRVLGVAIWLMGRRA